MTNTEQPTLICLLLLSLSLPLKAGNETILQAWYNAIDHNQSREISELIDHIESIETPTPQRGKTALMAAAAAGDAELFRILISRGATPTATNHNGGTTLMYACWGGDVETAQEILKHDIELNKQASNGWTALMMCAAKNRDRITRSILAKDADVNIADVYGWTPLMRAAYEGNLKSLLTLLDYPRTEKDKTNLNGQTALHLAAIGNRETAYRHLLKAGVDTEKRDYNGLTAQEIATKQGIRP